MLFCHLTNRLIAAVRVQIRSGRLTERRLSRLSEISQPHIHNLLRGARDLSCPVADRILACLNLSVCDLLAPGEIAALGQTSVAEVPFLAGPLGPGFPFPGAPSSAPGYPFPAGLVSSLVEPVVARAAEDPALAGLLNAGDLVLLDHNEIRRAHPELGALYAVRVEGQGLIRRLRLTSAGLALIPAGCLNVSASWGHVAIAGGLLEVVRARVVWIGRAL